MRFGSFIAGLVLASVIPLHVWALEPASEGRDGTEMVFVAEGEFLAGLKKNEPDSERAPQTALYLKAFYLDRLEVTNALYRRCVREGGCTDPSLITDYPATFHEDGKKWYFDEAMLQHPVVGITGLQAAEYCKWAGKRLPTAAEWEKAARGVDGRRYPWGNKWDGTKANWDEGGKIDGYRRLAPVGSFLRGASPYGALDMAGNVREWVSNMVLKGGSWYSLKESLRPGDAGHEYIVERDDDMGFRCAMDAEALKAEGTHK